MVPLTINYPNIFCGVISAEGPIPVAAPVHAAAPLLGLRVRISLETWMSVSCEFCVPITRPEESYRVWCA